MASGMLTKRQREILNMGKHGGFLVLDLSQPDRSIAMRLRSYRWMNEMFREVSFHLETSRAGLAELVRPAPPPAAGRVQCVNPICAKTAAQSKHPGCDAIICGSCFKMTGTLRTEYRALRARLKKVDRLWKRRGGGETYAFDILNERMDANWQAIVDFFTAPEKPEGLETFLDEMGWATRAKDQPEPARPEEL